MNTQDLFSLEGRVALITGGSRGIGRMIAEGFIAQGAKVYISARKADACGQTAKELSKDGGTCISIPMNVATVAGAKGLAAAVMSQEPKVDILVNNAGAAWGAAFDEFPEEGWDKVLNLNAKTPFFLTQALAPALRRAATAARLVKDHIHVTAIAPGAFKSDMNREARDRSDEVAQHIPARRIGTDEDMAGAAIFLASRAGDYVVGSTVTVDGGVAFATPAMRDLQME